MALIFTLAIVTILSGVVLAFLITMRSDRQQSFHYSQSIKANELALGALQQVAGNLQREISAGSTVSGSGAQAVFTPRNNRTAAPAHLGFADGDYGTDLGNDKLPRSVLQVSRAEAEYSGEYTNPPDNCASAVSSATPSLNGRAVSAARWNKPLFMGGAQAAVPLPFSNHPPQWVYFTRAGSRLCSDKEARDGSLTLGVLSNTNAVLGRYAYVIYDESALLDVNVAGYVYSDTTAAYRDELRGKAWLAYADLTKVPGLANSGTVQSLVAWRNQGGLTVSGSDYAKLVASSATTGFLRFTGTNGVHDNPLLGRQDLLDYLNKVTGSGSAAPYLTTFSRAVSAPSWYPTFDATSPTAALPFNTSAEAYRYQTNADQPAGINRNLANVRFATGGGVEHYDDAGVRKIYNVRAGDPLMMSRFSLKRLGWLANDPNSASPDPDPQYADAVLKCFGLRWGFPGGVSGLAVNGGNKCWNYTGSDGGGYPDKIKTLAEVADERREPNFFELLKAAILNGSLGRAPGPAAFNNGKKDGAAYALHYQPNEATGPAGMYCLNLDPRGNAEAPAPAQVPDVQIMQIGANIIDQWDADSYPTAIYFRYDGAGNFDSANKDMPVHFFGPVCMVFGNENLPYLSRVVELRISTNRSGPDTEPSKKATDADRATNTMGGWIQPEVWNPHQEMAATLSDPVPRHFQIRAYGGAYVEWSQTSLDLPDHDWANGRSETQKWYQKNEASEFVAAGTIDLRDNHPTLASSFYATTFMVRNEQGNYPHVTASSPEPLNDARGSNYPYLGEMQYATRFSNTFVAFTSGTTDPEDHGVIGGLSFRPFYITKAPTTGVDKINVRFDSKAAAAATFVLGWVDAAGRFHPYSFITGAFPWYYSSVEWSAFMIGHGNPAAGAKQKRWLNVDPRTDRFSLSYAKEDGQPCPNNLLFYDPKDANPSSATWLQKQEKGLLPQSADYGFTPLTSTARSFQNFMVNSATVKPNQSPFAATQYYKDPDGVVRPGDGFYVNTTTGDGLVYGCQPGAAGGIAGDKAKVADAWNNNLGLATAQHGRRPVILNRPFRSVGELGYVFRDLPYKTLDLFTEFSADAALLDVFCLADEARVASGGLGNVAAGQFNPTNAPRPVIEAVLAGAGKKNIDAAYNLGDTDGRQIAQNIASHFATGTNGALLNRAELVTVLSGTIRAGFTLAGDLGNKAYAEAPVRALSGAVQTRTWNVMIDVIAQSGRLSPSADKLEDFIVEGERRYWLHLAIDRYTGKIVDQQLEPVYE